MKFLKYLSFLLWLLYLVANFGSSLETMNLRLEAIHLSREYTVGGFSRIYDIAAYTSFLSEILFLVVAVIAYRFLKKKLDKDA